MKPDKYKKKDYFKKGRGGHDSARNKQVDPNQIQDEDKRDELPSKAPSTVSYDRRYYSNTLLRFLRSNIGRGWNNVYSELCKKLGDDKTDIKWYVDLGAYKNAEGKIVSIRNWGGETEVRGFYVLNGILGEQRKSVKYKPDKSKVKVTYVDGFVVFKHNNIYFKAPTDKAIPAKDLWVSSSADYHRTEYHIIYTDRTKGKGYYYRGPKFAIPATYIRQLSSKEIMHWRLPNTEINKNLGMFYC